MKKRILSTVVAVCFTLVSIAFGPVQEVNAAEEKISPNDLLTVLNDITIAGQAWESIGFDSKEIAEIAQLPRKEDFYYQEIEEQFNRMTVETELRNSMENELKNQAYPVPYAQNGNPPESPEEQNQRMRYITQVALNRYGSMYGTEDFGKYVFYLYMSHYIDNPNYIKENPGFDNIYAYKITADDIRAYENFVGHSEFAMYYTNTINFVNEFVSAAQNSYDLVNAVRAGKVWSLDTAITVKGLESFDEDLTARRAYLITVAFKNHYESTASVRELLDAIYLDLEPENVVQEYVDTCVLGILGFLSGTASVFGFGLSISLCYYNVFNNLYDRARLAALHYSLSVRVAGRADELIWG